MKLLTCKDVSFAYENNSVVTDICFELHRGDYLCIFGENGSGKSTLIRGLLCLKQPATGIIRFNDKELWKHDIGYLPQQKNVQKDFPASVSEVILSGCLNKTGPRPFYTKKNKQTAMENMRKLGLWDIKRTPFSELSGGQRQRVLLARALCSTKKLLILDEPVSGLDPLMTKELYRIIEKLNRDQNVAIIMVTHDVSKAFKYSSHILHLDNKQLYYGSACDYQKSAIGKKFIGGVVS